MVIFHSYVKLPEGTYNIPPTKHHVGDTPQPSTIIFPFPALQSNITIQSHQYLHESYINRCQPISTVIIHVYIYMYINVCVYIYIYHISRISHEYSQLSPHIVGQGFTAGWHVGTGSARVHQAAQRCRQPIRLGTPFGGCEDCKVGHLFRY